jgi:upstream activation factor subunit UAF30
MAAKRKAKKKKASRKPAKRKAAKRTAKRKGTKKKATKRKATKKKATKRKAAKKKAAKRAPKRKAKKKSKRKPSAAFMAPMTPSAALAAVVGNKPLPRTRVTKKLWGYIKKKGLQDSKNRRMINADAALKTVFGGKKQVSMFEMTKLVSRHLS